MMHQVLLQAAQIGGECVLGVLFVASIVGVAIISDRIWFFTHNRIDADHFTRALLQALQAGDLPRARSLATKSRASLCLVITAGLSQISQGTRSMAKAMRIAKIHERTRLEGQLGLLGAVGQCALLTGLLGTLFDLMQIALNGNAAELTASSPLATTPPDVLAILTPAAAGLLVAIPAMFADRVLKNHVRQTLRNISSVTQLLLLQLHEIERKHARAASSNQSQAA
jgi:biopolymer transport protein ExbB